MSANVAELERVFKTSLYGLAMFAGLILGSAEGSWLPYLTVPMAALGFWATESPGRFALGNGLSNAAGVLAVFFAACEFFGESPEGRLLAGTHLVVYATWIVFLQEGTIRKYWSICALCVLQVAVAAVLTNEGWYGAALVAFAVVAMWTLAVFSLYHAVEQQQPAVAANEIASVGGYRFSQAESDAGHSIQFDGIARWITPRFIGGIGSLALLALAVSAAFYVLTPRVWIGQRFVFGDSDEEPELGRRTMTGFSENVTLGEMGQILQSLEPVMTVVAYDLRSGEDRRLDAFELAEACGYDEPLFRGGILTAYQKGLWQADQYGDITERLQRTSSTAHLRQEIVLEPVAGEILFCFGTPVACEIGNDRRRRRRASTNPLTGVLRHSGAYAETRNAISYRLFCDVPAFSPDGIPRVELRSLEPMQRLDPARERYLNRCLNLPDGSLNRLIELARSLEQEEADRQGRVPTNAEMAAGLERYLRDSGQYGFTLEMKVQDSSIDPVEDFLFNVKSGHCEYFATALTLMLRAVNIPSRLMNGFKGGEMNYRGQIVVQQRHAHAWVEAWDGERWMVLDPTPASARAEKVQEVAGGTSLLNQVQSFFSSFWSDWVMNFTPERQRADLYEPLEEFAQKLWAQTEDAAGDGLGFSAAWEFLTNPREWFTWKGLLVFAGVAGTVYGLVLSIRWMRRWWRIARKIDHVTTAGRIAVPFYDRFLDLMRTKGFLRPAANTPAEFAVDVSSRLDGTPETADLGRMPGMITELYYRVRYGETELNSSEMSSVNAALERLGTPRQ